MGYNIYDELSELSNDEMESVIDFCERTIEERANEEKENGK